MRQALAGSFNLPSLGREKRIVLFDASSNQLKAVELS
jgi:hypothetical protein